MILAVFFSSLLIVFVVTNMVNNSSQERLTAVLTQKAAIQVSSNRRLYIRDHGVVTFLPASFSIA
jgi:hypothetical protein